MGDWATCRLPATRLFSVFFSALCGTTIRSMWPEKVMSPLQPPPTVLIRFILGLTGGSLRGWRGRRLLSGHIGSSWLSFLFLLYVLLERKLLLSVDHVYLFDGDLLTLDVRKRIHPQTQVCHVPLP